MEDNYHNKIEKLKTKLSDITNFNQSKNAGEVKFFIFDYDPKYEINIRKTIDNLVAKNPYLIKVDLYDLIINKIKESGYLEQIFALEPQENKTDFLNSYINTFINFEGNDSIILNTFKNIQDDGNHIILITGVGKVYPFLRTHTLLSNLIPLIKNNPVVLLYPGTFSAKGSFLKLFNLLEQQNYYRAFPLIGELE